MLRDIDHETEMISDLLSPVRGDLTGILGREDQALPSDFIHQGLYLPKVVTTSLRGVASPHPGGS
jgi:hypothetical protein